MDILRSENISIHFGGVKAVNQVDLVVEKGQIFGIIGPNGSGKTTFFNILTGIYKPNSGHIHLSGVDITGWPSHKISKAGVARTFQNIRVFKNISVLENIMIGEHLKLHTNIWQALTRNAAYRKDEQTARERARELLDFVNLSDKTDQFATNLAYGEQRRLEIARAMASEPKVLLLDEPTAGMNPSEADQVIHLIHEIRNLGVTIILIEHNMQVMMGTAEWIVALGAGAKIAEGTPQEIQYDEQVIQAYLGEED